MPIPRFSTLTRQAEEIVNKQIENLKKQEENLEKQLAFLDDPDNMVPHFFASGMSLKLRENTMDIDVREILEDASGKALEKFLRNRRYIQESNENTCMLRAVALDPGSVHQILVQGYHYEENLLAQGQNANIPLSASDDSQDSSIPSWDQETWKREFNAIPAGRKYAFHEKRTEVWESTLNIVNKKCYLSKNGRKVDLELNPDILGESRFYKKEIDKIETDEIYDTRYGVHAGDCLEFARSLHEADAADDLCILNLASYSNPGGGVVGGAGAQEEYLFRCSDYFRSLFQFGRYYEQYGIPPAKDRYPLDKNFGGVFSHAVTVFRDKESTGYALTDNPWKVNFIAAAAPRLKDPVQYLPTELKKVVINTIRTILRIAFINGQRRLVLGALGCGAFKNPPLEIAGLFRQVLEEEEFSSIFKEIHFAIFDDHNARHNRISNIGAFRQVFADLTVNIE